MPAPRLSRLQVTPGQIVVSRHGRQISLSTIRFAFRASVASFGALIAIEQAVPGARTTKGCVPRAGHVLKRCTTYRLLTLLSDKRVRAGSNTYRFSGKIGSKPLPAGSYSVVVIAANLGGWSNELTHGFKVVSAKPHPARPARPRHARNPARQPPRKPASRKTAHAKPRH